MALVGTGGSGDPIAVADVVPIGSEVLQARGARARGAVISIGMLEALAAVVPAWEQRRASDPMLQRLLVETALDTK